MLVDWIAVGVRPFAPNALENFDACENPSLVSHHVFKQSERRMPKVYDTSTVYGRAICKIEFNLGGSQGGVGRGTANSPANKRFNRC